MKITSKIIILSISIILIIILLGFIQSKSNKETFLGQSPFNINNTDLKNNELDELDTLINKSYNSLTQKSIYAHEMLTIEYNKSEPLDSKMIDNIINYFPLNNDYANETGKELLPLNDDTIALLPEQIAIDHINQNPNSNSLRFIIGLHSIYITIIVSGDTVLNSFEELDSKQIGLLPNIANIYITKIFDILGIKLNYNTYDNYNNIVNAWESNSLDAIILICSHIHPFVTAFSLQYKIKFLILILPNLPIINKKCSNSIS